MTYPLLDHCNRRNAAELARVVNLSAAELVRVESIEWAPTTEEVRTRSGRSLGRGDRIYCGMPHSVAEQGIYYTESERRYFNIGRPFDEAHMEANLRFVWEFIGDGSRHYWDDDGNEILWRKRTIGDVVSWTHKRVVLTVKPLLEDWVYKGEPNGERAKAGNESAEVATPPNHGHGAVCGCVRCVKISGYELSEIASSRRISPLLGDAEVMRRVFSAHKASAGLTPLVFKSPPPFEFGLSDFSFECAETDCPHCSGTGRLICDDERAGRVSPSHAAGGYAEWQQKNAPRITGIDWGTGPSAEIMRIWETRRRVLDGVLTTIAAHSPDFPREHPDDDQTE